MASEPPLAKKDRNVSALQVMLDIELCACVLARVCLPVDPDPGSFHCNIAVHTF